MNYIFEKFDTPKELYDYCEKYKLLCKPAMDDLRKRLLNLYGYKTPPEFDGKYGCIFEELSNAFKSIKGDKNDVYQGHHYGRIKILESPTDYEDIINLINFSINQSHPCLKN